MTKKSFFSFKMINKKMINLFIKSFSFNILFHHISYLIFFNFIIYVDYVK